MQYLQWSHSRTKIRELHGELKKKQVDGTKNTRKIKKRKILKETTAVDRDKFSLTDRLRCMNSQMTATNALYGPELTGQKEQKKASKNTRHKSLNCHYCRSRRSTKQHN